ncbi:hypothetical protein OROHE_007196 [Orobanche hederae]
MNRKNAVESILGVRDILISVHNPFVVSIFLMLKMVLLFERKISGNGVFKWRRSFHHADKSRLLG